MADKVEITLRQAEQFNRMLRALKTIRAYQTPSQMRRDNYGLADEEVLEMAYENIQEEARQACRRVKPLPLL